MDYGSKICMFCGAPEGMAHNPGCRMVGVVMDDAPPAPIRKEKIRVVTTVGWFDLDKPTDFFDMRALVRGIKADGYLVNDTLFVPWDHLVTIFIWTTDKPPPSGPKDGVVLDFPGGKS